MKTTLLFLSFSCFQLMSAPPLTQVEVESSAELAPSRMALEKAFPDVKITVSSVQKLNDVAAKDFFPGGAMHRVSFVVTDAKTNHAALLTAVIFKKGAEELVLPMSGDHSEFADLLHTHGKKIGTAQDAILAGKAYAAIYGIKTASQPAAIPTREGFVVEFRTGGQGGNPTKEQITRLEISTDHPCSEIVFSQGLSWWVSIQSNGSGVVSYGSNPIHSAHTNSGVFDLNSIEKSVTPLLVAKPKSKNSVAVNIVFPGQTASVAKYTDELPLFQALFKRAIEQASFFDPKSFQKVLNQYPPFGMSSLSVTVEAARKPPPVILKGLGGGHSSSPKVDAHIDQSGSAKGWRGVKLKWLDEAEAAPIKFDTIQKNSRVIIGSQKSGTPIKSRAEAAAHLDIHISMAMRPNVAFENDQHFFFSGGTTAYPVTDFSKGLAVKKANGEITTW